MALGLEEEGFCLAESSGRGRYFEMTRRYAGGGGLLDEAEFTSVAEFWRLGLFALVHGRGSEGVVFGEERHDGGR